MSERNPLRATSARLDGVDTLRGLSILAVILLHIRLAMHFAGTEIGASLPRWLAYLLFNNGGNGVTVFFAVSGFLITLTSVRRFGSLGLMRPGVFYRIRFARIAPPLLLLLLVLSILHIARVPHFRIRPGVASLPRALLAALTFHLNWLEAARGYLPANWDVLWSLSVEEMFYLLFPSVCVAWMRQRWGGWAFVATLLAFVAMAPFAKTVWTTNPIWQEKSYLGGMGSIALGCLSALLTAKLGGRGRSVAPSSLRRLAADRVGGHPAHAFRGGVGVAALAWAAALGWHERAGRHDSAARRVLGNGRDNAARAFRWALDSTVPVVWTPQLRGVSDPRVCGCGRHRALRPVGQ